jgi:UDP-N-acetyl-D-mannosaminuronate dehydrogenase
LLLRAREAAQVVICVVTPMAQVVKADRVQVVRARMLMATALEMGELVVRKRTVVWVGRAVAVLPETDNTESRAN